MENLLIIPVIIGIVWTSYLVLKVIIFALKAVLGLAGVILMSLVPGVFTYFITHNLLGFDTPQAAKQSIISAIVMIVIGVLNSGE